MHRGGGRRGRGTLAQGAGGAIGGRGGSGDRSCGQGGSPVLPDGGTGGQSGPSVLQGNEAGGAGSGGVGGAADRGRSLGIKQKVKKSNRFPIPFVLEKLQMVDVKDLGQRGKFLLKKPSNIHPSHNIEVYLDLESPACLFRLQIMRRISHPNILRIEGYIEDNGAFTEPISGLLSDYVSTRLNLANNLDIIPSQAFENIVRQSLKGLFELHANGAYHGNFRLQNTYYQVLGGDNLIVKLAGFTPRGFKTVDEGIILDLNDFGSELQLILNHIRSVNTQYDCLLLEDLVKKLKSIKTTKDLVNIQEKVLNYVFFWDKKKRTAVFTCTIPKRLDDPNVIKWVKNYHICKMPWDNNTYHGLKKVMNDYRNDKFGTKYKGSDKVHHFRFVSGAYIHEEQVQDKLTMSVDDIIQLTDLGIFLEAHRLMP